jgi:adhesin/invasin
LGTSANIVYTVLYQASVPYKVALNNAEATTIAAVKLATTSQAIKVVDQFGSIVPSAVVTYTTGTRNTVAAKTAVTGADGVATISTTDAALSTVTTDDVLTASITASNITGGPVATTSAATTIKYYATAAEIAAATVALAVTKPTAPGTADSTGQTYDSSDLSAVTTTSVTVDTNLTNGSDQLKLVDQIKIVATIANSAAANPQGVPVSVSGSAGVFFLQGGTVGEVLVGTQTGAKTTLASYTASGGTFTFQAAFTKSGTATITVTSGTVSKTYSIKVVAGAAGIVSATASTGGVVVAKVTDLWGNPVSGATVSFVAASGALLGGNFPSLSASTGADGTASTVVTGVTPTASYVVSATITGGDTAVVADTTNGVPAGKATVDVTVTGTGVSADAANTASLAALTTLINSLIAKINALNKLVIKIQKKVRA